MKDSSTVLNLEMRELLIRQRSILQELEKSLEKYDASSTKNGSKSSGLVDTVERYIFNLLIYLSAADGITDQSELDLIDIYFGITIDRGKVENLAKNESVQSEMLRTLEETEFIREIHKIFPEMTDTLIDTIETIGLVMISIDGYADMGEIKTLSDLLFKLRVAARYDISTNNSHQKMEKNSISGNKNEIRQDNKISAMEELDSLTGLESIKKEVHSLINLIRVNTLRESSGLPTLPISLHLVFSGSPGTGKTTVARILADIYKELGVLSQGHLVEVDRSGLVAGYVGQTAVKTQEVIDRARGGILFIDEAYSLTAQKEGMDYGGEAIETLLKAMEDYRSDFVLIVAGYTNEMEEFLQSNPGLKSRFNKFIHFPDYSTEEMVQIFSSMANYYGYRLAEGVKEMLSKILTELQKDKTKHFANARTIRNILEKSIQRQANRIVRLQNPNIEDLATLITDDLVEG